MGLGFAVGVIEVPVQACDREAWQVRSDTLVLTVQLDLVIMLEQR
jgi:hypothetical protein